MCSKCGKNRHPKFYVSDRGRVCSFCRRTRTRVQSREQRLLEKCGITLDEYAALLKLQKGRCAICKGQRPYNLDIDHDHRLEKLLLASGVTPALAFRLSIRGLLCKQCNRRLLTSVRDSIQTLRYAIAYLEGSPVFAQTGMIEEGNNEVHKFAEEKPSDPECGLDTDRAA